MSLSRGTKAALWGFALLVLAFVYVPIAVVALNSFNSDRTFGWPPPSLTTKWWSVAMHAEGPRDALWTSVKAGVGAT
ncbi:MAG: binding-protein-dependent transport system inner rane component, partial [Marmoricola sp.]|nr:binding-protein-dependent transport system inner rane component [Marmoricola sp.]